MILPVLLSLAQAATAAPQATVTPAAPAKPKMICVVEEEIGSRLNGKRICRTKADWDVIKQEAREGVESKLRNRVTGTPN